MTRHIGEAKTARYQLVIPPSWLNKVDDWRFANRIGSRADAIRQLVEKGIEASRIEAETTKATTE